ncbi:MAG: type II CAAX endopeptidase family protein [bacterium]
MNAQLFFRTESGSLRAVWRVILFFIASLGAYIVADAILGPIITLVLNAVGIGGVANQSWISAAGLVGGTVACQHWIDHRPWREVWLDRTAARPRLLSFGFAVGAVAVGIPIVALIAAHWLRLDTGAPGSLVASAARISIFLLPAALFEELLTRGYILSVLRESWGWPASIVATSVGFGMLHLANPGATTQSVVLVTLAGFFLAGVLYATKSLYAAWMAHFAWNWTMAVLFHTAVSGIPLESPRYRYVDAGPDWATGGEWGPEGGVPAGLGMGAGIVYLFAWRGRSSRRRET